MKEKSIYSIYALFLLLSLMTEFFYISIGEGYIRIYHILSPVIILMLINHIPKLFKSGIFIILLGIIVVNFIASILSDNISSALTSYMLLIANISVAISVALLMISRKINYGQVVRIFIFVTVTSVAWSVIQLVVLRFAGQNWGLSEAQVTQLAAGFAPGFRTEANTFAKYINVSFFLLLPTVYTCYSAAGRVKILSIFSLGLLITFTRSVLYTIPITVVVSYIWYIYTGRGSKILKRLVIVVFVFGIFLYIYSYMVGSFNEYAAYKMKSFFDTNEILYGGSSGTRMLWQQAVLDSFFESSKTILIGNGWGQVYTVIGEVEFQAGGAELILFLAYGGILSGALYLLMQITAISSSAKLGRIALIPSEAAYYQGVSFACIGMMITGMINGSVNAPEYWIVYGLAIHANYNVTNGRILAINRNNLGASHRHYKT